jgi:hypothetical protein
MGATGLVAFIVTLHEVAAGLGVIVALVLLVLGSFLLRGSKKLAWVIAVSLGAGLITFGVTARILKVPALDVEVVRAR